MCRVWPSVSHTPDALQDTPRQCMALTPTLFSSRPTAPASRPIRTHFHTVGLPDAAVHESRDRVCAAKNCGYDMPPTHITINLAPADIKKEGSGFDVAHGVGHRRSLRRHHPENPDCLFVGELSLDSAPESRVPNENLLVMEPRITRISPIAASWVMNPNATPNPPAISATPRMMVRFWLIPIEALR